MQSTTHLNLNLQNPNHATVMYAVQNDRLSRKISAVLADGATAWTPPSGTDAIVRFAKPDGTKGFYDVDENGDPAVTWTGNVATIMLAEQVLTVAGNVLCQVNFYNSSDQKLSSFSWVIQVQPSVIDDDTIVSTDYFNVLTEQISAALAIVAYPPYINATTHNWMIYDTTLDQYVDSGISAQGEQGEQGIQGVSISSVTKKSGTGAAGTIDVYNVNLDNSTVAGTFNVYNGADGQGSPGSALPLEDGTASAGSATAYSREDHRHPSDTSKVPTTRTVNGKALSNDISLDASDVNAVPEEREVNGKALSEDITLDAGDIGYGNTTVEDTVDILNAKNYLSISMESNAVGEYTYQDVFGNSNELSSLYPDAYTFAPMYVVSGTPTIEENINHVSQGHNVLKCFGSTSQQISNPTNIQFFNLINGHYYYVAFCINVTRYVSGWCGISFTQSNALPNMYVQEATDGWIIQEQIAQYNGTTGFRRLYIGTGNSANADCYIAVPVAIDMTALNIDSPSTKLNDMHNLYKNYLTITDTVEFRNRKLTERKPMLAATILSASSESDRFLAAKQLYDLARKLLINPYYTVKDYEYTVATKGYVCKVPDQNTALYENYTFNPIYSKNSTTQDQPASVTKVMNAITALLYIHDIHEQYTIESGDVLGGSGSAYAAGDVLTVNDLLHGMFLESSNTCANGLGTMCGRIILRNPNASNTQARNAFVQRMRSRCTEIGCTDSNWQNASGYNAPNTYSSVSDMMRILIEAASFPEILRVWNKKTYTVAVGGDNARDVSITTTVADTNLENFYYIFGGKTGHADTANALVLICEPK